MSDATNKVLPKGRTLKEFQTLEQFKNKLYPAEKRLLEVCRKGTLLTLAEERPTEKNDDNTIRAEFLRFMALGGDDQNPVHERGVSLKGAWIEGVLNLSSAVVPCDLRIEKSHFTYSPNFNGTNIDASLSFKGSKLLGFSASRAVIKGSLFLNDGFTAEGEVRLLGMYIGGDIYFKGASLKNNKGSALNAQGMVVDGAFFFRDLKHPVEGIRLSSARVRRLVDDSNSWGSGLILNGFVYGYLAGSSPVDAQSRLQWLKKQRAGHFGKEKFRPQPWMQIRKVLQEMGHTEDARQIAIQFENHLRKIDRIGQTPPQWGAVRSKLYSFTAIALHCAFGLLMAYGYRPLRLFAIMCVIWLACGVFYWYAALQGVMAPSNPLVFQNLPKYECCKSNWYLCDQLPEEYTGFSPMVYSLDVLLPLVNLQQEQDWAPLIPTPKAGWWEELTHFSLKHWVRLVVWFEILFGWVASLLFVAVVSGLSKRSED